MPNSLFRNPAEILPPRLLASGSVFLLVSSFSFPFSTLLNLFVLDQAEHLLLELVAVFLKPVSLVLRAEIRKFNFFSLEKYNFSPDLEGPVVRGFPVQPAGLCHELL